MTLANRTILLSQIFLLATYLVQAAQIFPFSFPSAGFFFYLPPVVTGIGFALFMLNSQVRIRMEETYLERTFGDRYRHYRKITGKYFPKIHA
jgi:protein-S-isoprenylcysteine O-methyltransferase Ste14